MSDALAAGAAGTIVELLEARAVDIANLTAVSADGDQLSFRQLRDDARWLAGRLSAQGVGRCTRCALVLPSGLEAVRAVFGVQMTGAAAVAIDTTLPLDAQVRRVTQVDPLIVVTLPEWVDVWRPTVGIPVVSCAGLRTAANEPLVRGVSGAGDASDPAYLQFTSGSTGEPRAAVISHRSLMAALRGLQRAFDIGPNDVMASAAPLHLSPGMVRNVFGPVAFGCPAHMARPSASGAAWLDLITAVKASITSAPDFAYRVSARLVRPDRVNLSSLRVATSGGEQVRAGSIRTFEQRFGLQRIVQPAYGLSEATLIVSSCAAGACLTVDDDGAVSCGRPIDGVDVRIAGENGAPCRSGEEGEILVRGAALFSGYFSDDASTGAVLRDGWLHTGDRGVLGTDGCLYPRTRGRALIKRAGVGIAPGEVEARVDTVPGVLASAVVGLAAPAGRADRIVVVVEVDPAFQDRLHRVAAAADTAARAVTGGGTQVVLVEPNCIPRSGAGKTAYMTLQRELASGHLQQSALFVGPE